MSQIVNSLPPLPFDDMPYDNYIIYHTSGTNTYRCSNFDYLISDTLNEHNELFYHQRVAYDYDAVTDSWVWLGPFDLVTSFNSGFLLIASNVDIYNYDGSVYCSATDTDYFRTTITLISTSITSSTFSSAFNEVKFIMPLLIVVIVAAAAFRKAFNFVSEAVRGA